ncbi:MAG: Gfo/Idh/MocA family oxidoreductase [Alphaproteobacteria bacterium]
MTIRVGLIGYGLAGRFLHAPLIVGAGFEIAAIATSRTDAASDFPNAAIVATPETLLARDDVDLAIVVTPDHLHVAHTRLALEAGKHVVVDKPFAPTSEGALALIALANERRRMLSVFQNRRWDADFLTLQKLLADDALGEIVLYIARWDRYRPNARKTWHDDHMQGELFGLGPHLVDQALALFGTPDWLFADVYNQRGVAGANDGFEILMGKGRLRISLAVNLLGADETRSLRVHGARASFVKTGLDPQEAWLRARKPIQAPGFDADAEKDFGVLTDGATHQERVIASERGRWLSYYEGVRRALETNGPPPVDPRDAARNIAILEAASESSTTGRRVDVRNYLARVKLV